MVWVLMIVLSPLIFVAGMYLFLKYSTKIMLKIFEEMPFNDEFEAWLKRRKNKKRK